MALRLLEISCVSAVVPSLKGSVAEGEGKGEREGGRERERMIFRYVVHYPRSLNSWGSAMLKPGSRNSLQVSHVGGGKSEDLDYYLLPFQVHYQGS